jgi:hypothetical protein
MHSGTAGSQALSPRSQQNVATAAAAHPMGFSSLASELGIVGLKEGRRAPPSNRRMSIGL